MKIDRLVVASKNVDKVAEIRSVLGDLGIVRKIVDDLEWPDVEETGSTLEENAALKALAAVEATGLPALADDTGLEVEALDGAPGVHTARFAGPDASYDDNVEALLAALNGRTDRDATFRSVMALAFPDGRLVLAAGGLAGSIAYERRGGFGFGYDPIFEVDGRTLGEMDDSSKNQLSHRTRALTDLASRLRDLID